MAGDLLLTDVGFCLYGVGFLAVGFGYFMVIVGSDGMVVGMPTVGVRIFGCGLGLVVDGVCISMVGGRFFVMLKNKLVREI